MIRYYGYDMVCEYCTQSWIAIHSHSNGNKAIVQKMRNHHTITMLE